MACIIGLLFLAAAAYSQAVDPMASFRGVDGDAYVRLHYENDLFAGTDRYYSQGITLECVHPVFADFFLSRLLVSAGDNRQAGIALEHLGYTPTSIEHSEILHGDRPFAAALTLRLFSISCLDDLHARITSSLTLGVVGPAAGGYELQAAIHRLTGGIQPLGWQNQIRNDLAIDYEVGIEKNVIAFSDTLLLNTFGTLRAGTLSTKLSSGLVLMVGKISPHPASVFSSGGSADRGGFTLHAFCQPMVSVVGYDATLQGGLFNPSSPYTIAAAEVERLTFQTTGGVVAEAGPVCLEYSHTFLTKEFQTGSWHSWGGVRLGVKF
jgi:lipid A 3-O-deacylase